MERKPKTHQNSSSNTQDMDRQIEFMISAKNASYPTGTVFFPFACYASVISQAAEEKLASIICTVQ